MADLAETILCNLASADAIDSLDLAKQLNEEHQKIVGAIKSLQSLGEVIQCEQVASKRWELTDEGRQVLKNGSHEAHVFNAIPTEGITQAELMKIVPNAKVGFSKAMSAGWIQIDKKAAGGPKVTRKVDSIEDKVKLLLGQIQDLSVNDVTEKDKLEFKKRKMLQEVILKSYLLKKGAEFSTSVEKPETDLTPEMITSGSWCTKKFKPYNFDALGVTPPSGHLHPLLKVRTQFRNIFLEMGFTEMPTNNYVESSFWNFDALFQPQQHPARDAHDTFFVSDPALTENLPMDYLERVKKVHSEGGYGSQGYKYDWKIEEAKKNLLRTHTTAVSARMLYKLAQEKEFRPVRLFSIDRVYRNESLDATHLAEFHQIEGVVADYNLTLGDLMGILGEFFKKLGIKKIRFKPAYNPYTEPSMEIFSYHDGLKKWVEIGNSGIFRPEMLLPMGLPEDVVVIAWGLSLERPTMIMYGIDNIRELVGHKVNLQMVQDNPICRLTRPATLESCYVEEPSSHWHGHIAH
ncbi:PREDICTED: phenylalanine--tRNA ligase alpha subunit-like [Priapulus caudatus]|uniref:phenylalanine--tRNA ligase n=1 Tax=Priapulus caudatus TaxID=37621 RepID=A0ABM1EID7_PRICU|nr:PREDICTED: phenylalanine--tRNA ligase alpha subunit-like [Priapulus caudatus]